MFSNAGTSKEFPDEAVKFASIHKRWLKLMKVTYQTKNVLQCCTGGEVPKARTLDDIGRELELCKKSLSTYLLSKRQVSIWLYECLHLYSHFFIPDISEVLLCV